jgi:uncharacterized protein (DUF983 family)
MLIRGLLRRCAWCGGKGAFFNGWFKREDRCHTCGLLWQRRLEGFELGAMTMNVLVSYGTLLFGMGIGVFLTYPDVAVVPLRFLDLCLIGLFRLLNVPSHFLIFVLRGSPQYCVCVMELSPALSMYVCVLSNSPMELSPTLFLIVV